MATPADFERLGNWAYILQPDPKIDRRKCRRTVPMEVLSLGLPRTGTLSMQEGYKTLGITDPYHFSSIFANIQDCDMWISALRAKLKGQTTFGREQYDQLLGHCGAVTDVPCAILWKELMSAYPDAKVVLVERDMEKWLKSMDVVLDGSLNPVSQHVLRYLDPFWYGRGIEVVRLWVLNLLGTTKLAQAKKNAAGAYQAHYSAIKAAVPKDRLLVYQLGDGWGPLCEFLGKPVPDVPFPHLNEAKVLETAFAIALCSQSVRHWYQKLQTHIC